MKHETVLTRIWHITRSLFLSGLFAILPITLTILILNASFRIIRNWTEPLSNFIKSTFLGCIPYAEFFIILAAILVVGAFVRVVVLRPLIHALENVIFKIPLFRTVYSGIKQLVEAFSFQEEATFKQVVLVEFPRQGVYSIGFLTSAVPATLAPQQGEQFFNIFIPTTPNPTSGFFIIAPEREIHTIDLTGQEAITLIISGGIIQPERFIKK
jgi:uncharacterized membrane protein